MTHPEMTDLDESTTATIHEVVPMAEIGDFFDRSFSELAAVLERQGITPAGPAFACYAKPPGETADVEVGFPVEHTVEAEGNVRPSSLPAGRTASLVHVGGYEQLGESWGRLGAWIAEQDLTPGSVLWEIYATEPSPDMDPADLRTELFWTIQ